MPSAVEEAEKRSYDVRPFASLLLAEFSTGTSSPHLVAFKVYDMDRDGFISNGELFLVLKMMVGNNLKDGQLQQIVDKTIMEADKDGDGKLSFDEFVQMVSNTVRAPSRCHPNVNADLFSQDIVKQMTLEDLF